MINRLLSALFICSLVAGCIASADSTIVIQNERVATSLNERIVQLEAQLEHAKESDQRVIELLLTDAKYELEKREYVTQLFTLARTRYQGLPADERRFIREAVQFDVLAIIQAIPFGWLSASDQRQAVELMAKIEADLQDARMNRVSSEETLLEDSGEEENPIEAAIVKINNAREKAKEEDLSLIAAAKPNQVLSECLQECESVRELLMDYSPDVTGASRSRWEAVMMHLSESATVLKQRQHLKYTLWAEGRYRETEPEDVKKKLESETAMKFYRRLSEVNVSLVAEPSLAREITKRLFELYDCIDSPSGKQKVRYEAIINLEKRKTLDDF